MTRKRKEVSQEKAQLPSKKQLITVSIILAFTIALGSILSFLFLQPSEVAFSLNAAIIDQLGEEFPNPTFVENVTNILKIYGFNVTYYNKTLNVDFFKGLAKYNYGIIILRVHSALREDNSTVDLFTSEEFSSSSHIKEWENGLVVKGILDYSGIQKEYFAITSKFIESLNGNFPKSIVIAMGCWSLKSSVEQMAEAFIKKGAKAYIGWTALVEYSHTDNETLKLLRNLFVENKTLDEAVKAVNPDLYYGGRMEYYPQVAGNLRISDLITEAKVPITSKLQSTILNYYAHPRKV